MAERCPNPQEGCQYAGTPECLITRHHVYWPSTDYQTELEKTFRGMPVNSVYLSRCDHDDVHTLQPPEKPSVVSMAKAVVEARNHSYTSARKQKLVRKLLEVS